MVSPVYTCRTVAEKNRRTFSGVTASYRLVCENLLSGHVRKLGQISEGGTGPCHWDEGVVGWVRHPGARSVGCQRPCQLLR